MKSRYDFPSSTDYKDYLRTYFAAQAIMGAAIFKSSSTSHYREDKIASFDANRAIKVANELIKQLEV